ncbi:MAG TPA: DUF2905 domain-containing protein [Egibacteraceae bacterium]
MDSRSFGWMLVLLGGGIVLLGLLVATGALSWFGRLPGDIRIETEHTRVYIPITSMIIVSVVLTVLLSLFRR